jgi:apolipoprotein N-acyltransferase
MKQAGRFLTCNGLIVSPLLVWISLPGRFSLWPLLCISLVPLFCWINAAENRRVAFRRGLASGIILYSLLLYWVIPVLMQYGNLPWYVALPCLFLLSLYMSIYLAVFATLFFQLNSTVSVWLYGAVPALWVGLDWLRSWLFGGFPWMDLGYGFWSMPSLLQVADVAGHHGYTFFVVLINFLVFTLIDGRISPLRRLSGAILVIAITATGGVYSRIRWNEVEASLSSAQSPLVGIVQGNIEQNLKWSPQQRQQTILTYLERSQFLMEKYAPTLIIWPETALPFYPINNDLLQPIKQFVRNHNVALITGAPWYEVQDLDKKLIDYYNSALLMSADGTFSGSYYKSHLVPYGEYVPLKRYMPFISPLVEAVGDFTPGVIDQPLMAGTIRAGILICYESIFSDISRDWVNSGANVLVNLTNDAWYGKSSAPYQSWAMTVFRAVEARRSLVRSANTGISGVIDPLGRILSDSGLFVQWAQAVAVPLNREKTLFIRGGYWFAPGCAAAGILISLLLLAGVGRSGKGFLQ